MKTKMMAAIAALMLSCAGAPAFAQEVWKPQTPTGGAPINPDYFDKRAEIVHSGGGQGSTNITIAPTKSNTVVQDYSVHTTDVQGGQTNVQATGQLANGGTFTVTTGAGSSTATGANSSTTVTSNSTLGNDSTVTNTTSTNTGND